MRFIQTELAEVILVEPCLFEDSRGFFMETYQVRKFAQAGLDFNFVQDNHAHSSRSTLSGEIFDVVVDLRRSSCTFGRSVGLHLSARDKRQLWIPPGFAHGYYVLSEQADVLYKATDYYDPISERAIIWNDPTLKIPWPIPPGRSPILSSKDLGGLLFTDAEVDP
jgi:dTDP-4-dehydrorhamnose 3,5-epimerase